MRYFLTFLTTIMLITFLGGCKPSGNEELKDKEHVKVDTVPADKVKVADSAGNKTRPLGP